MRTGRPTAELVITEEERAVLRRWARRPKSVQDLAFRSKILLACGEGKSNTDVAAELQIGKQAVGKWRARFVERRLDGLLDEPKQGTPRKISDEDIERVLRLMRESQPQDAAPRSTRSLAAQSGMSHNTVRMIRRAFELQPRRSEQFRLAKDHPLFVEKVRYVAGLYVNPPDRALVLCIDQKVRIRALDQTQSRLPMRAGQMERRTHNYTGRGTPSLFSALDVKTRKVSGECQQRHRTAEFRKFLDTIDVSVPADLEVHLIMDDQCTQKTAPIRNWLAMRPRFHLHFAPTHAWWLNMVERWFAALTEREIRRGVHRSVQELEAAIKEYLKITGDSPKPFVWTKQADDRRGRAGNR
jgi:transposase